MRLYHGSTKIIKNPQYGYGNIHNDYGLGFYCTEDLNMAKEWACPEARDGFANIYDFEMEGLRILDLHSEEFHVLNWIAILLKNRVFVKKTPVSRKAEAYLLKEFLPTTDEYDVICGYRADDSYFSYARDFLNNAISIEQLDKAMRLGDLGNQVVLMSREAMERVKYIGYEVADAKVYYPRRLQREQEARAEYLGGYDRGADILENEQYVLDLMRKGVRNDDACLFRTISG